MTTEQASRPRLPTGPDKNDFFEVACFWASIWSPALFAAWVAYNVAEASGVASEKIALGVSAACLLASALLLLVLSEREPMVAMTLRRYRHLAILALAGLAGYCWHYYQWSGSQEARNQRAALWACSKMPQCRTAATQYGGYVYIAPAE